MKNNIEYEKGVKIAEEIATLMKSQESDPQSEELQQWLSTDESAINVIEKFSNVETFENCCSEFRREKRGNDIERLVHSIQVKEKTKKRIRFIKVIASSAVASLCISFLVYVAFLRDDSTKKMISKTEMDRTIFTPTLILEDGENIDLTDRDMVLNIKKSGENRLIYDRSTILEKEKYNTLVIPKLFTYNVELSDGTIVCLNANSELKYPVQFNQDKREVYLEGEAYFSVKKENRPFVVRIGETEVKVYGTTFNVNGHMKNEIRATLLSGSIGLRLNNEKEIMLGPGELAIVNTIDQKIEIKTADLKKTMAWIDKSIYCYNDKVEVLLNEIELWYGIQFKYDPNLFSNETITSTFDKKIALEYILESIGKILDVTIIRKEITVYEIIKK